MARYVGPKHRLARRLGVNILEKKSNSLERRLNVPPGQHGPKGSRRKMSEYATQLQAKQTAKWTYGVLEKQFRRYVDMAQSKKGATGVELLSLLERRLDNVVYRLGLAKTRNFARQLVSHGHVRINNKRVSIPSYTVRKDEVITVSSKAMNIPIIKEALDQKDVRVPKWLQREGAVGKMVELPVRDDMPSTINEQLIVEYYSR
jgi:small subunit ribosomal protein S4